MNTSQRITINQELHESLKSHLNDLSQFGVDATIYSSEKLESITDAITRLFQLTLINPADIDNSSVQDAIQCLQTVESFFQITNCYQIFTDTNKEIGRIYSQVCDWYYTVLQKLATPINDVWEIISPVSPDTLTDLGRNHFEACWASPVPMMDIEILRGTEGVSVIDGPYELDNLPAGLAVTFVVHHPPKI